MSTTSPSLYAHDLRLAGSEHGGAASSSPSPSKFEEDEESRRRRRRQKKKNNLIVAMAPSTTSTSTSTSTPSSSSSARRPDALEVAITFLKKRDGIDKVLKIMRYAAKILLAANQSSRRKKKEAAFAMAAASPSSLSSSPSSSSSSALYSYSPASPPSSPSFSLLSLDDEPLRKLKAFESAVGDARKAYRMGKFLQGVDAARKAAPAALRLSPAGVLAFVAAAGDGMYYFLDQFTFFVRAGVLHKSYAQRISRAAAVAELCGYFGSASLSAAAIAACSQRETELIASLRGARKLDLLADGRDEEDEEEEGMEGDEGDEGDEEGRSRSERRTTTATTTTTTTATTATAAMTVSSIERELSALSALRRAKERALAQDACDALLAFSDLSDGQGPISGNPTVLAAAGLASALLGARKVWG